MKLVFNKTRLTVTADLPKVSNPSRKFLKRVTARAGTLLSRLEESLVSDIWSSPDLQKLIHDAVRFGADRVLVAIALPSLAECTVVKASMVDRLRGIAAHLTIPALSNLADPRKALAVTAAIAKKIDCQWWELFDSGVEHALWLAGRLGEDLVVPVYFAKNVSLKVFSQEDGVSILKTNEYAEQLFLELNFPIGTHGRNEATLAQIVSSQLNSLIELSKSEIQVLVGRLLRELGVRNSIALRRSGATYLRFALLGGHDNETGLRNFSLPFEISKDRMKCIVLGGPKYQSGEDPITYAELTAAVRDLRLFDVSVEKMRELHREILQNTINGFVIADGKPPVNRDKPFFVRASQKINGTDIPKTFVLSGEAIGAIRYQVPASSGYDIFGQEILFSVSENSGEGNFSAIGITIGEGVLQRGDQLLAAINGAVSLADGKISVKETMSIEGSLLASAGYVRTTSALSITGNVESGASVSTEGAIQVGQSFFGEFLRTKGDLTIAGGINASQHSKIIVGGNLRVKFIQSGYIRCKGSVTIESNMTGGVIEADGEVTVLDASGGIFGGTVICRGVITAPNVGRNNGNSPKIWFGTPVKAARRKITLQHRQKVLLSNMAQHQRLGLARSESKLAVDRINRILANIQNQLDNCNDSPQTEGKLAVQGLLCAGVQLASGPFSLVIRDPVEGAVASLENGKIVMKSGQGS